MTERKQETEIEIPATEGMDVSDVSIGTEAVKAPVKKRPPNKHVPPACMVCPFMQTIPFIPGAVNVYMCGHPKIVETTGGPFAVTPSEQPDDACPFVVYEEKYKDKPIMRAFWRWRLKRAKRMTF